MATDSGDSYSAFQLDDDPNEVRSKFPELNLSSHELDKEDIRFIPPLYKQRYALGIEYLKKMCPGKVVDFGCAECKFMWAIRNQNYEFVREIIGVDIDKIVLESNSCVAKPVMSEYLFRRKTPLRIGLYCGSLTQWDPRLVGVEFVSLIEVIEHLEEDTLTQLPSAIFGIMRPKSVFVTTPNSEFNILFKDFSGFRHPDHKFEWNRDEFMKWCDAICHNFHYQVEYCGAGEPPMGFEEVGYCSQGAFFTTQSEVNKEFNNKHLQDNNNSWEDCMPADQSDSLIESPPRESIFSDLKLTRIGTTEVNKTSTQQPDATTQSADEFIDELVYKEIICNDFPLQDPNHTPERQLLIDLEYHGMQIARNEWSVLLGQGVREEDINERGFESNGVCFEPGRSSGYLVCYVSISDRLMSYPQIKFFGNYEDILNSIMSLQSSKLNTELTHFKVELLTEDPGNSDEANSDECDNNSENEQSNWGNTFQEVVKEKDLVGVPENWDDEPWDT